MNDGSKTGGLNIPQWAVGSLVTLAMAFVTFVWQTSQMKTRLDGIEKSQAAMELRIGALKPDAIVQQLVIQERALDKQAEQMQQLTQAMNNLRFEVAKMQAAMRPSSNAPAREPQGSAPVLPWPFSTPMNLAEAEFDRFMGGVTD